MGASPNVFRLENEWWIGNIIDEFPIRTLVKMPTRLFRAIATKNNVLLTVFRPRCHSPKVALIKMNHPCMFMVNE